MPTKKTARKKAGEPQMPEDIEPAGLPQPNLPGESIPEDLLAEDRWAEIRQNLQNDPTQLTPTPKTGGLDQFFKTLTQPFKPSEPNPIAQPFETEALDEVQPIPPPPPTTRKLYPFDAEPAAPETTRPPWQTPEVHPTGELKPNRPAPKDPPKTRKLSPFEADEPENRQIPNPDPRQTKQLDPREINPSAFRQTNSLGPRPNKPLGAHPSGTTHPLFGKQGGITSPLNKLAQRLDAQGNETPLRRLQNMSERRLLPGGASNPPRPQGNQISPFVDDEEYLNEVADTLATKIKHGTLPADTINLLIRPSMGEAEVQAVCLELGFVWEEIPGENRKEKTDYLITYFNSPDNHQVELEIPAPPPPTLVARNEEDWDELDARLTELQASLKEPRTVSEVETTEVTQKLSFFEHIREDFSHASTFQKLLVVSLTLVLVTLLAMLTFLVFFFQPTAVRPPAKTPLLSTRPSPIALELPGGWIFDLKAGAVQEGAWAPVGPEWLAGTEICRLISLPWNLQLEVVYQTFEPGDELLLTMSNSDLLRYEITEIKSLDLAAFNADELNQLTQATSPCLIVILTEDQTTTRRMLIAKPVLATPWQPLATATFAITPTPNPAFPTATLPLPPASPTPTKSVPATPRPKP